jgi:hypothetical protein
MDFNFWSPSSIILHVLFILSALIANNSEIDLDRLAAFAPHGAETYRGVSLPEIFHSVTFAIGIHGLCSHRSQYRQKSGALSLEVS